MGRIDRWQTIPADSQSTFRGEGRWSTTSSRMTIDCNFDDDTELSIWEKGDSNRAPRTTKWVCLTDVTLSLSFSHSLATLTNVSQGTHTPHPTTTSWSIRVSGRCTGEGLWRGFITRRTELEGRSRIRGRTSLRTYVIFHANWVVRLSLC